jgi:hypothetical protein
MFAPEYAEDREVSAVLPTSSTTSPGSIGSSLIVTAKILVATIWLPMAVAYAVPKKDIRGVFVGMDFQEAVKTLEKNGARCAVKTGNYCIGGVCEAASCVFPQEDRVSIRISSTSAILPRKALEIDYSFMSREKDFNSSVKVIMETYPSAALISSDGGLHASFQFESGESMSLDGCDIIGAACNLRLIDHRLENADEEMLNQKKRESIPAPKF